MYQCLSNNDMFKMFVYLLTSAVEKHAPFKNVLLKKKTLQLSKRFGLTRNANFYYVNSSWPRKNTPRFHHAKIGQLIANYDRNCCLSWKKQEQFSWKGFNSLKLSKDRWNFINNVRGQNQPVNIAALKNSFGDLIVDDKKPANR